MPDDRPDLGQILPTVYDLTAWLRAEEDASTNDDHALHASLVVVNAHISNHYWAGPQ